MARARARLALERGALRPVFRLDAFGGQRKPHPGGETVGIGGDRGAVKRSRAGIVLFLHRLAGELAQLRGRLLGAGRVLQQHGLHLPCLAGEEIGEVRGGGLTGLRGGGVQPGKGREQYRNCCRKDVQGLAFIAWAGELEVHCNLLNWFWRGLARGGRASS